MQTKKWVSAIVSYAREAILEHLEDLEDVYLATERLQRPTKTYSAEDVKHELGL